MDNFFGQRDPSHRSYKQVNYSQISQHQAAIQSGCDIFFQLYIKSILEAGELSTKFMKLQNIKPVEILNELVNKDPYFKQNKIGLVNLTKDEILVDINQFKFAFQKIIENAIFYNEGDMNATLQIENAETEIVISCKDEGIGLDQCEQQKVFNPFFRGFNSCKFSRGIGLGLTLSKEILYHNNANIRVESAGRGFGTSVYVSFPIKETPKKYFGQASRPIDTPQPLAY